MRLGAAPVDDDTAAALARANLLALGEGYRASAVEAMRCHHALNAAMISCLEGTTSASTGEFEALCTSYQATIERVGAALMGLGAVLGCQGTS